MPYHFSNHGTVHCYSSIFFILRKHLMSISLIHICFNSFLLSYFMKKTLYWWSTTTKGWFWGMCPYWNISDNSLPHARKFAILAEKCKKSLKTIMIVRISLYVYIEVNCLYYIFQNTEKTRNHLLMVTALFLKL